MKAERVPPRYEEDQAAPSQLGGGSACAAGTAPVSRQAQRKECGS